MARLEQLVSSELECVVGGAEPSVGARAWQHVKEFSGGFVAGAYSGRREDQPWGNNSSQTSKLGGELGVMATLGVGSNMPRRR